MYIRKNILSSNIAPKYIKASNLKKIFFNDKYQIVQIISDKKWRKEHILFSVHLTREDFSKQIFEKLDKNKKIVLYGEYHSMAEYYRVLDFCSFNVYLVK